jgi:hypothetical protein
MNCPAWKIRSGSVSVGLLKRTVGAFVVTPRLAGLAWRPELRGRVCSSVPTPTSTAPTVGRWVLPRSGASAATGIASTATGTGTGTAGGGSEALQCDVHVAVPEFARRTRPSRASSRVVSDSSVPAGAS